MAEDQKVSRPIRKNGSQTIQHLKEALITSAPSPSEKVLIAESFTTSHLQAPLKSAPKVEVQSQNAHVNADLSSKEQVTSGREAK